MKKQKLSLKIAAAGGLLSCVFSLLCFYYILLLPGGFELYYKINFLGLSAERTLQIAVFAALAAEIFSNR